MSKKKEIDIAPAVTMKLILLGFILILIGAGLVYFINFLAALPILYLGLVFFLSIEGASFNVEKNQVKKYKHFFFFKIGTNHDLSLYNTVLLTPYSSSTQFQSRASSTAIKTKSFDLYLANKNKKLLLKEFDNYEDAFDAMQNISETFGFKIEDLFEEMRVGLMERRQQMQR